MKNIDVRLKKLEAERAAAIEAHDAPIRAALIAFIQQQPASAQAAFWRVTRARLMPDETDTLTRQLCGGHFTTSADDEATHARLLSAFLGDDHGPAPAPVTPDLDPVFA